MLSPFMRSNLLKRGFLSLIVTQFFGAANDNILKGILVFMVIDGAWQGHLGTGGQGIVGICFSLPFILLSGYAGQFADRHSKQWVTMLVKLIEIPIAFVALVGFWTGNLWVTLASLVLLTSQSAFFGPAKYGMIPEVVAEGDLSRANGAINMMTNIAVILGTLVSGMISDRYSPQPDPSGGPAREPMLWLPGAAMVGVAVLGLAAALAIPRLKPGDPGLKYDPNPFSTYIFAFREMLKTPLFMVTMAWGYFYLLAGLALLIVPEYTTVLAVSREEAAMLLGVLAVAIGLGCAAAGLISGHRIEPRLIPVGGAGITLFCALLALAPPAVYGTSPTFRVLLSNVSFLIFGCGFFSGFYIIPLQALLQKLSPRDERGRFLGTANCVSFGFFTLASLIYWMIRPLFGTQPQDVFLVSAVLMAGGTLFFLWRLRHTAFRKGMS